MPALNYSYAVANVYPHDRSAFTQGIACGRGSLYEGTGLHGRSTIRRVCLTSGEVSRRRDLAPDVFGEDIAVVGSTIVQLTWKSQVGFVYDAETLAPVGRFAYGHEGWGITAADDRLIVSDGTSSLRIWDSTTFAEIGRLQVSCDGVPVERLNALQYIRGAVLANIWKTSLIAHISLATGTVLGWIDVGPLYTPPKGLRELAVASGVAFDPESGRLLVTGKLWPHVFALSVALPAIDA